MAQHTLTNGPVMDGSLKTAINSSETLSTKLTPEQPLPVTSPSSQPTGPFQVRPTISRSDSRPNFQYRPPFPSTNSGPQSILSGGLQSTNPVNQQVRPQQHFIAARPPVASPPFGQRGPLLGAGGTSPAPRIPQGGGNPQTRPTFRPQSPFARPPLLAQRPHIFQQSSVPAFNRPKPTLEESLNRPQTLDSSEFEALKHAADSRRSSTAEQRPPSVASLSRSFSASSERKLSESQEGVNVPRQESVENVDRNEETVSSRPESKSGSRMGLIFEAEDKLTNKIRPESRGEVNNGEITSPIKEPVPHQIEPNPPTKKDIVHEDCKKQELDLKLFKPHKGDNDSGVDESTQGNEQSCNGDSRSSRKISKSRTSSATPTKGRSASRGSKTPSSLQSPDSAATTPGSIEKKKVPMNKVQVGAAPSPNLKVIKSKIGSLENTHYKPGGGRVKIENKKLDFANAGPKIEAKNDKYAPKGGEKKLVQSARCARFDTSPKTALFSARSATSSTSSRKILSQKLEWNAKSKIGSLDNASHKPKGGDKKIETVKLNFKEKATSKVGSKDNIKYQPGGGDVKIENKKIELNVTSKIGSLDNVKHKPAGGDKKIFDDKEYLKQQKSGKISLNESLSGSQVPKAIQVTTEEYSPIEHRSYDLTTTLDITRRILDTLKEEDISARKKKPPKEKPMWRY